MPRSSQQLSALIPGGYYEAPKLLRTNIVVLTEKEPVRLLLTLEGGYELEIPVIPSSNGEFFQALNLAARDHT